MGLETEVQESSIRHKEAKKMLRNGEKNEGETESVMSLSWKPSEGSVSRRGVSGARRCQTPARKCVLAEMVKTKAWRRAWIRLEYTAVLRL